MDIIIALVSLKNAEFHGMITKLQKDGIMKNTAEDQSSTSNSPKISHEIRLTLQDALDLLGLKEAPFGPENYGIMIGGLQDLLKSKGRDWIIKHRKGLVEELNMVANL
jgi:hypothetical protein